MQVRDDVCSAKNEESTCADSLKKLFETMCSEENFTREQAVLFRDLHTKLVKEGGGGQERLAVESCLRDLLTLRLLDDEESLQQVSALLVMLDVLSAPSVEAIMDHLIAKLYRNLVNLEREPRQDVLYKLYSCLEYLNSKQIVEFQRALECLCYFGFYEEALKGMVYTMPFMDHNLMKDTHQFLLQQFNAATTPQNLINTAKALMLYAPFFQEDELGDITNRLIESGCMNDPAEEIRLSAAEVMDDLVFLGANFSDVHYIACVAKAIVKNTPYENHRFRALSLLDNLNIDLQPMLGQLASKLKVIAFSEEVSISTKAKYIMNAYNFVPFEFINELLDQLIEAAFDAHQPNYAIQGLLINLRCICHDKNTIILNSFLRQASAKQSALQLLELAALVNYSSFFKRQEATHFVKILRTLLEMNSEMSVKGLSQLIVGVSCRFSSHDAYYFVRFFLKHFTEHLVLEDGMHAVRGIEYLSRYLERPQQNSLLQYIEALKESDQFQAQHYGHVLTLLAAGLSKNYRNALAFKGMIFFDEQRPSFKPLPPEIADQVLSNIDSRFGH